MYEWLPDALKDGGTVVTANRRLARILQQEFSNTQIASGKIAWPSPNIFSRQDWLAWLIKQAGEQQSLPTRLNAQQSQVLWENCLRKEIADADSGIAKRVRLLRDTWQELADWRVGIREVAKSAQNDGQRKFAAIAGRYLGILEHEHWIDDAALGEIVLQLIDAGQISIAGSVSFAGFERHRPLLDELQSTLTRTGTRVNKQDLPNVHQSCELRVFPDDRSELLAAGTWAREQIDADPQRRVAIIVNDLEQQADRITRRVRDGATPGWQHGPSALQDAVNVSYGQRLGDFPAIATALSLLRWLVHDISSREVAFLLCSPLLGRGSLSGRVRLELRLRDMAERRWSPSMITAALRGDDDSEAVSDWMSRLSAFSKRRLGLSSTETAAEWATQFDEILDAFGWPGAAAFNSQDFQLINRWRELLNEFARLGLVSRSMSAAAAVSRIDSMAGETLFQAESGDAIIQLIGPLEAAGSEFDAVWISGASTANWPPPSAPSALLSRRLQEKYDMPDCTPDNTLQYARSVLNGLVSSAPDVICSFAENTDDSEQSASDLLIPWLTNEPSSLPSQDWYAASLVGHNALEQVPDPVPPVATGEKIRGGAGTVQRQINDPISAFCVGRLSAKILYPQAIGIPPLVRGNLIHDALYKLYIDLPSARELGRWQATNLDKRIAAAINFSFSRHERNTDGVLQQLLTLERERVATLVQDLVAADIERGDFQVEAVEGKLEFCSGDIRLPIRFDRIDRLPDGGVAILDYKTGTARKLLSQSDEAQEIQLFVYACAVEAPVSALALVNIDSRNIEYSGAGTGFSNVDEWPDILASAKQRITAACEQMAQGDVGINMAQGITAARPLNLLSRYTELRRVDR